MSVMLGGFLAPIDWPIAGSFLGARGGARIDLARAPLWVTGRRPPPLGVCCGGERVVTLI